MRSILLIQTAFIGDVILATGLVEKLHQYYPEARLDFLVRKGNEGLLKGHPYLTQVLVWDKRHDKYRNLQRMLRQIRAHRYDCVINLQRFFATGLLTAASGARITIGFNKNPLSRFFTQVVPHFIGDPERPRHEIARNHDLIRQLTDEVPALPRLYPSAADQEKVRPLQQAPYVCIAPSSVWFTKQFPPEKWVELLRALPAGLRVYLLGGKEDAPLCEQISQQAGRPEVVNLAGELNLLQSTALIAGARLVYVNDSAPLHLASATNTPTVAVFCSTVPEFGFGPLAQPSWVVQTPEPLVCKPCTLHGRKACPLGHYRCAYNILTAQLLAPLAQLPTG